MLQGFIISPLSKTLGISIVVDSPYASEIHTHGIFLSSFALVTGNDSDLAL
jgi:hypothetical protein